MMQTKTCICRIVIAYTEMELEIIYQISAFSGYKSFLSDRVTYSYN